MNAKKALKEAWGIIPEKTALVVIDMQRAFMDKGAPVVAPGASGLVPGINELAGICRRRKIPVVFVRMVGRADLSDLGLRKEMRPVQPDNELEALEGRRGVEFCDGLKVMPDDYVVPKIRYSALIPGSSNLEPLLRGLGRDSFIICGILTDVCVASTTIDAMMLGFKVFFAADLTVTLSEERQKISLEVIGRHFAKVVTFEQIKKELQ
jgi:nicotinamidase-related amidase